jgi:hypothetical protein
MEFLKPAPTPERKRLSMAERLSNQELASFKELLMSNGIDMESLVQLLIENGIFTKQELLGKINQVQAGMVYNSP